MKVIKNLITKSVIILLHMKYHISYKFTFSFHKTVNLKIVSINTNSIIIIYINKIY